MKIQKVVEIKNLGKFLDYHSSGDMTFSNFSIIYGENGKGKTTFSTILRSLKTGDPLLLLEKKSTSAVGLISIQLLLEDNQIAKFDEAKRAWNISNTDLEIFDSVHVNNNVYSGDHVDHLHKKNLYYLVIGERGVNLANEINSIDSKIKVENEELKVLEAQIKGHIHTHINVEKYINLQLDADLKNKLIATEKTLEELQESENIASTNTLASITVPEFDFSELESLLGETLESISEEATSHVKEYCLSLGSKAEGWLKQGLEFIPDANKSTCPFCQQDVSTNQVIEHYRAYFSQAYKQLKEKIENYYPTFAQTFSEKMVLEIPAQFEKNLSLVSFWSRFISITLESPSTNCLFETRSAILSKVSEVLAIKKDRPLEPIGIDAETSSLISTYTTIADQFAAYNAKIKVINQVIEQKKADTKRGDINENKSEKTRLMEMQNRFSSSVQTLCNDYTGKKNQLDIHKKEKQQLSNDLKEYSEDILDKYKSIINDYLLRFGADFTIIDPKTSLSGGTPSATYCLSVDGKCVPLGTNDTSGEPCFRSVLSDGDKSSLAFALFLAQLRSDPDLSRKTIIIDDPITSLDIHRKKSTYQEIKKIAEVAKQCIVLSHDAFFLKLFLDDFSAVKTFQIKRAGRQSGFSEWDIHQETQPTYLRDYFRLQNFINKADSDMLGIARCIRPVLEGNLRVRYPKEFMPKEWLGDFIKKIDIADTKSPLASLKKSLPELNDINDYSKRYHHQQNPAADMESINDVELSAYVARTLSLLEKM